MKKTSSGRSPLLRFFFLVYCGVMLWLLFFRSWGWDDGLRYRQMLQSNINLVPLYTIRNYLQVVIYRTNDSVLLHCIINLAGNVFLFIPLGYLLPRIFQKQRNFFRFLATCTLSILLVELTQLFALLGRFDVDDIILNLAGMVLGFAVFHIINRPSAGK